MPEDTILIADDEAPVRNLLAQFIQAEAGQILLACNGREAVELAKTHPIDLAILDIVMPDMDGVEALKQIKKIDQTTEVLMITGYAQLDPLGKILFEHGAYDYLLKPFDSIEIRLAVRRALRNRELILKDNLIREDMACRIQELEKNYKERTFNLRQSQIQYRNMVEGSANMILITQGDQIRFANTVSIEMTGYSRDDLMETSFVDLLRPDERQSAMKDDWEQPSSGGTPYARTFRLIRKDGASIWVEDRTTKTLWGENPAAMHTIQDISARMRAEKIMMRAEKLSSLGQLSAGLAHELRNPLAVVNSCSQFCLENLKLEQKVRENFEVIYRNSQRACRLINELLAFARPDKLAANDVDVNQVVTTVLQMTRLQVDPGRVSFVPRLTSDLPYVKGDKEKLTQVFFNLIQNAIQAVSGKGTITLESRCLNADNLVEVNVMDDGPGIPEELRKRVFDPFFTTKQGGTGLGLSICHSIVQQHMGTIHVEPLEDRGVCVSVRLPTLKREERDDAGR